MSQDEAGKENGHTMLRSAKAEKQYHDTEKWVHARLTYRLVM